MAKPAREACLMEGKFFIEIGQLADGAASTPVQRECGKGMESNGVVHGGERRRRMASIGVADDGDSDDEEETRKSQRLATPPSDGDEAEIDNDDTGSEKENSPQPPLQQQEHQMHDSGIDSFLTLETGTPASEVIDDYDDVEDDFHPVVYSKRRRGSRGREARSESSNCSSDSNPAMEAALESHSMRNKSGSSENDAAPETNKQKKRKKKKNKKRAAESPLEDPATDWEQLDMIEDARELGGDMAKDSGEIDGKASNGDTEVGGDIIEEMKEEDGVDNLLSEEVVGKEALGSSTPKKESKKSGKKRNGSKSEDDVFDNNQIHSNHNNNNIGNSSPPTRSPHDRSLSESYENKSGIKSILKNRSRTFSGESSCSDVGFELPSSSSGNGSKKGGFKSRNRCASSLTNVTQSLESLSIGSTGNSVSDSCCEEGSVDIREEEEESGGSQYCASSWTAGATRKSVHFSSHIDRKRFRSGAPPQNVGKGRRNSGSKLYGNPNQHGKKRHMSEGDAGTGTPHNFVADAAATAAAVAKIPPRADSPTSSVTSVSSEDLFEMEELDEEEENDGDDEVVNAVKNGLSSNAKMNGVGSLLGNVPEEVEDPEVAPNQNGGQFGSSKAKKNKKNKGKNGKGKRFEVVAVAANSESAASKETSDLVSTEFDEVMEGWSIVGGGGTQLGCKNGGVKNSSDLSVF